MNTLKQQLPFIKKAFVFLLGSWIFAYGTASVVTIFWLESFQNISVEGIRSYFQDPFPSIFVSALKMYVVVYILFYTLPDKIQNAKSTARYPKRVLNNGLAPLSSNRLTTSGLGFSFAAKISGVA